MLKKLCFIINAYPSKSTETLKHQKVLKQTRLQAILTIFKS